MSLGGQYALLAKLDVGGMATVHLGRQIGAAGFTRIVAIKSIHAHLSEDALLRAHAIDEARLLGRVQHPNVVRAIDVVEENGQLYVVMEYVEGASLSELRRAAHARGERLPRPAVAAIIAGVLAGLHAAHEATSETGEALGIVHRDVTPRNVLVGVDGVPRLIDFGIARATQRLAPTTRSGDVRGTPMYMAPEQIEGGPLTRATDVFLAGILLWEALTGAKISSEATHEGRSLMQLAAGAIRPPRSLVPDLDPALDAVVVRALARAPADRFASALEMAAALEAAQAPFSPRELGAWVREFGAEALARRENVLRSIQRKPASSAALAHADYAAHGDRALGGANEGDATNGSNGTQTGTRRPALWGGSERPLLRPTRFGLLAASVAVIVSAATVILLLWQRSSKPTQEGAPASPSAPRIAAIRCAPAALKGDDDPELARALGIGACGRLAVELGVAWSEADAADLVAVDADIAKGQTQVTLSVAGQTARATGPAPIAAIEQAVSRMAGKLTAAPWSPRDIHAWGAKDEASARRIARVFRRRDMRISPDIGVDAIRLLETDPDSLFTHLLLLMLKTGSADALRGARDNALARLDQLPPSRAHFIRGFLLVYPTLIDREEGVRLMRQSYAEAPGDAEMVALYASIATRIGLPEGYGVFERLQESAPTRGIAAFDNVTRFAADKDLERNARYVARLIKVWPEARASLPVVEHFFAVGALADAEAAVAFGRRLGVPGSVDYLGAEIDLDLARGRTEAARSHVDALLASPSAYTRAAGANALATSYFLEGREEDGLVALSDAHTMGRDGGWAEAAVRLVMRDLRARRWLGLSFTDAAAMDWLARVSEEADELSLWERAAARVHVALARGARATPEQKRLLEEIERAAAATEDRFMRANLWAAILPLVRHVRGDAAAASLWPSTELARAALRASAAIDAALALEARSDLEGAAAAYKVAIAPAIVREAGLERVIAALRLSALYKRMDRPQESEALRPILDRVDAAGSSSLREAILAMK